MFGRPMLAQIDIAHPEIIADGSQQNRKFFSHWSRFPSMDHLIPMFNSILYPLYEFPVVV